MAWDSSCDLASSVVLQGKVDDAEGLFRRALEITGAIFGKDHPNYKACQNNLAAVLRMLVRTRGVCFLSSC